MYHGRFAVHDAQDVLLRTIRNARCATDARVQVDVRMQRYRLERALGFSLSTFCTTTSDFFFKLRM
jgi:hypothetical protein